MTNTGAHDALAQDFVQFSLDCGVLKFGQFKTKAGRMSPYFFNAGLFDDGAKLGRLAAYYAQRLLQSRRRERVVVPDAIPVKALHAWVHGVWVCVFVCAGKGGLHSPGCVVRWESSPLEPLSQNARAHTRTCMLNV